jgi:hypothetical protein
MGPRWLRLFHCEHSSRFEPPEMLPGRATIADVLAVER